MKLPQLLSHLKLAFYVCVCVYCAVPRIGLVEERGPELLQRGAALSSHHAAL